MHGGGNTRKGSDGTWEERTNTLQENKTFRRAHQKGWNGRTKVREKVSIGDGDVREKRKVGGTRKGATADRDWEEEEKQTEVEPDGRITTEARKNLRVNGRMTASPPRGRGEEPQRKGRDDRITAERKNLRVKGQTTASPQRRRGEEPQSEGMDDRVRQRVRTSEWRDGRLRHRRHEEGKNLRVKGLTTASQQRGGAEGPQSEGTVTSPRKALWPEGGLFLKKSDNGWKGRAGGTKHRRQGHRGEMAAGWGGCCGVNEGCSVVFVV